MDRALGAFGFDRVLYESNWFVSEAMGEGLDKTARMLWAACERAGATTKDMQKVRIYNCVSMPPCYLS